VRKSAIIALTLATLACLGSWFEWPGAATGAEESRPRAPLFNDLGSYHYKITTRSTEAQRYFNQGLTLAYAFNHAEAGRSFREAAQLDPECAICWWGAALVLGPNINAPMDPADAGEVHELVQKALAAAPKATEKEHALIEALARRYTAEAPADRKPLDEAYAEAMRAVAKRFPGDPDISALLAEALMDLHPWNLYETDGTPLSWTAEIVGILESVLAGHPDHFGAIHFYIHATEASNAPGRAEPHADRLGTMVPGAGHLVHMPSHTYIRLGRYDDAIEANRRATKADDSYVTQCRQQGVYPLAYVPHNHHFLWSAASLSGRRAEALSAAASTDHKTNRQHLRSPGMGTLQHFTLTPLYTYVRFGMWKEILAEPSPPEDLPYPVGIWRYARGLALLRTGDAAGAEKELAEVRRIETAPELEKVTLFEINSARALVGVASEALAGEIAAARREHDAAVGHLTEAVRREDALLYSEPRDWQYPVRHALGAVLLEAGRAAAAEAVYREDLRLNPENGWALFGLARSLEAQGREDAAAGAEARFRKAWAKADVKITASRF